MPDLKEDGDRYELRGNDLTWRRAQEGIVVLDQRSWTYLSLNGSAAVLWEALSKGASQNDLARSLMEEYGISAEIAERDVGAFLEAMKDNQFLDRP